MFRKPLQGAVKLAPFRQKTYSVMSKAADADYIQLLSTRIQLQRKEKQQVPKGS